MIFGAGGNPGAAAKRDRDARAACNFLPIHDVSLYAGARIVRPRCLGHGRDAGCSPGDGRRGMTATGCAVYGCAQSRPRRCGMVDRLSDAFVGPHFVGRRYGRGEDLFRFAHAFGDDHECNIEKRAGGGRDGRFRPGGRGGHLVGAQRLSGPVLHREETGRQPGALRLQRPRLLGGGSRRTVGNLRKREVRRPVRHSASGPLLVIDRDRPERPRVVGAHREPQSAHR